ncbi:hypothetical protein AN640_05580 [Candidatus Epulonipiscium fishelsonii]|uniref:Uncharacterized protein n=1 Tax=Candidatus Epulonipiscium fishelsonii TaxID=77094 RepID=A0ACC8XI94_9FIRM|nr:hypothetical protein AN640_05580 [Epulopiscium sp. SCG-D08WGA-EpuloA1]OON91481.1 MAG: hypothetical protein ATN32_10405 [Epulopiscium sp. AS2M-Bin002]
MNIGTIGKFWLYFLETPLRRQTNKRKDMFNKIKMENDKEIIKELDIDYIGDGAKNHTLDIYSIINQDENTPVIINIHGGGLIYGDKELNFNFSCELVKLGFKVVNVNYTLIPDGTFYTQIKDILAAFTFISSNALKYKLNIENIYVIGESAGGLLALMATGINNSSKLQDIFESTTNNLNIQGIGLLSIMLNTQLKDMVQVINPYLFTKQDREHKSFPYLRNPLAILQETKLPKTYLMTSEEDFLNKETLALRQELDKHQIPNKMIYFKKGTNYSLRHCFPIHYPIYKESVTIYNQIKNYFLFNNVS